jgi:hypothetical protein
VRHEVEVTAKAIRLRSGKDTDPAMSAKIAGLHYSTDTRPGIARRRRGKPFSDAHGDGRPV